MKTNSLLRLLENHKVIIPMIQRDFAQGRTLGKVPKIRERFLNEIVSNLANLQEPPLELDFIYGYTYEQENASAEKLSFFTPLDGQQRLTTLFLIHWYVAAKEGYLNEETEGSDKAKELLKKFSYATRHSSRLFCEKLTDFCPLDFNLNMDEVIKDQHWFFNSWENDPTVASMLVMLKAIQQKFKDLRNIWPLLSSENPKIIFHLLPMEQLGLPDDLYIKMNSRGKELTDFEHFKSQFSEILNEDHTKIFNDKIDKEWSDLFWNIFKNKKEEDLAKIVDAGFLSFFWYITDIITIKKKILIQDLDWLDAVKLVYKGNVDNVKFLFNCLDLFERLEKKEENFFETLFYIGEDEFTTNKTRLFFQNSQINLFRKCAETYGYEGKSNSFSIGEQLMLYACILNQLHQTQDFNTRIRKIRNTLSSSEFQLRKDNLETLYLDIESLVLNDTVAVDSKLSKAQLIEEQQKASFLQVSPVLKVVLHKLEDHNLLRGTISIFDIDNTITDYANAFESKFNGDCDFMENSLAMLTLGDYSQGYGKLRRLGNKTAATWRDLFTPNEYRKDFDKTKNILKSYLDVFLSNPKTHNIELIKSYLVSFEQNEDKPKDWIYYYIKYDNFKFWQEYPTNGFYHWEDFINKPYECNMMFRSQFNGRHWSPFLLELSVRSEKCSLENYGNNLQLTIGDCILIVSNTNDGFKFLPIDDESSAAILATLISLQLLNEDGILKINQNTEEIDKEDRIEKCSSFLLTIEEIVNE